MPDIAALLGRLARSATLRPTWQRYGFAIVLPIVALMCTALMMDLSRAPFFALFSLSVVLSSIFGGMKPGFVTVAVGVILNLLMSEPQYSLRVASPDDITRLVVFAAAGSLVAAFVGAAGELQQKVDLHRERSASSFRTAKCCCSRGMQRRRTCWKNARKFGMEFDVLAKPVHPGELLNRVKQVIAHVGRPRILLVDDDEAQRYATAKLLIHAGYEVIHAENGKQALNMSMDGRR